MIQASPCLLRLSGHYLPKRAYRDNARAVAQDHIQRLARYAA
jgi:hypothetical protein